MTRSLFPLFFMWLAVKLSFSQTDGVASTYYSALDTHLGYKNNGAFNGREYLDVYPELSISIKTNNKFYNSYNFIEGYIFYGGQPYYNVELKYDLIHDLLLIEYNNERANLLSLNPEILKEFELNGERFVRLENAPDLEAHYANGYFKEAFSGKTSSLYIKYRKTPIDQLNDGKIQYTFKASKVFLLQIHSQSGYAQILSKKSILKAFPERVKTIRLFYKNNPVLRRKSKEAFFIGLLRHIDNSPQG